MANFTKGDRVIVSLPMMPGREFLGEVKQVRANGIRVRYDSFGAKFTDTFDRSRVREA